MAKTFSLCDKRVELKRCIVSAVRAATSPLPRQDDEVTRLAHDISYPVMLKASWGGKTIPMAMQFGNGLCGFKNYLGNIEGNKNAEKV